MSEPVIKLNDKGISIAVFEFKNDFGKTFSANLQRSYKKKDSEEWTREEIHCYEDDLLKIANLCTQTYNAIVAARKVATPEVKTEEVKPDNIPF